MSEQSAESVRNILRAFSEIYPDEEWGFAHIVISDYNTEDHWLNSCLDEFRAIERPSESQTAAARLLELLLAIPETKRCDPEIEDEL